MTSPNPKGVPLLEVGRDVHGRFRKGNQGGPGNPFARKVAALRKTLLDAVSEQDVKEMVESLKLKARQGDTAAIKLLLQYCVGKPAPPHDPDRMDADEWHRLQQMRVSEQQFWKTVESVPASLACHQAQTSWPCEVQEGFLAEAIHLIHCQLRAGGQPSTTPSMPSKNASPHSDQPVATPAQPGAAAASQTRESNAPGEATAPTAAKGQRKSSDRREPAGRSRRDSRSPTQPPSPNGGNEEEQRQALEQLQRLWQPSEPADQGEGKPPRG